MAQQVQVQLKVNGVPHTVAVEPRWNLADMLREQLGLTGTHLGCEHGACGACTVILNGKSIRACLFLAVQAEGAEITTIEGLATGGQLHPLQAAFQSEHGLQCGFCTPGMIMTLHHCLSATPDASEEQIRECISGNYCRCTGYLNIVRAAQKAQAQMADR